MGGGYFKIQSERSTFLGIVPNIDYLLYSYDWSGQIYVTGSNDGHLFVCDARVSNNFKVLGHLGQYLNVVSYLCWLNRPFPRCASPLF